MQFVESLLLEKNIKNLKETCLNKCKPYIAYIPNINYWRPNTNAKKIKKQINIISKRYSIPFIDGEKVIIKNEKKFYAPKGPHLSIYGYKVFSKFLSENIQN